MSVAVSCNLSDGVILGVDSAVTLPGPAGVLKNLRKCREAFQLGDKPIGAAFFGLGSFGTRGMGSYLRQFHSQNREALATTLTKMAQVVEAIRQFFSERYLQIIVPLEQETGKPFAQIPPENRPVLGIVIGGSPT